MEYNIKKANSDSKNEWNNFVKENNGSIFHLFEWSHILKDSYGYNPVYVAAILDSEIKGIVPAVVTNNPLRKRLISLPCVDYAGPLGEKNAKNELAVFLLNISKKKNLVFESYSLDKLGSIYNAPASHTFVLETENEFEKIWEQNFDRKTRNLIRKAEKNNVTVKKETPDSFLDEYYSIYLQTMKKLKKIPHSKELFKNIFKHLGDKAEIYSANFENKRIAGMITFNYNNTMHIWSNASLQEHLTLAPNDLLYSNTIQSAAKRGIKRVDFGSTIRDTGHYKFKEGFGGEEKPIYVFSNKQIKEGIPKKGMQGFLADLAPANLLGSLGSFLFRYFY